MGTCFPPSATNAEALHGYACWWTWVVSASFSGKRCTENVIYIELSQAPWTVSLGQPPTVHQRTLPGKRHSVSLLSCHEKSRTGVRTTACMHAEADSGSLMIPSRKLNHLSLCDYVANGPRHLACVIALGPWNKPVWWFPSSLMFTGGRTGSGHLSQCPRSHTWLKWYAGLIFTSRTVYVLVPHYAAALSVRGLSVTVDSLNSITTGCEPYHDITLSKIKPLS